MLRSRAVRLIPLAIILFWVVMMGLLVQRELLIPERSGAQSGSALVARDSWMGVYLPNDSRVGYVNVRSTPGVRDGEEGARLQLTMQMRLVLFGTETDLTLLGSAWTSSENGLHDFEVRLRSADHDIRIEGNRVEGEDGQQALDLLVHTAGETIPTKFPIGEDLALFGGSGFSSMTFPALTVGETFEVEAFDPLSMSVAASRVRCTGEETLNISGEAIETKVLTIETSGMESRAWVAADEEVVRMTTPMGFYLQRVTPEEALTSVGTAQGEDLLSLTAVQPTGVPPFRGATRLKFRVSGIDDPDALPTGSSQRRVAPGVYEVMTAEETNGLPEVGTLSVPAEFTAGGPFVQAGHPAIKKMALSIIGETASNEEKADQIATWVYENIDKRSVVSLPSALEVLDTLQGDCNEHTVLYAALARSVGIPTRIALGVVWSETLNGFYYHAWPEVYVEGGWVRLDPTLGQRRADATHVKLLTGSIEKWPQLIPFLGRLQLEILEIE